MDLGSSNEEPEEWVVGGSVDEMSLTLRIMGEDLVPADVSAVLRCSPDQAWSKGEEWVVAGQKRLRSFGMWSIHGADTDGRGFERELLRLLDRISNDELVWDHLNAQFDVDVFCGVHLNAWNRGFSLSPLVLQRLAARRLRIDFDIYCNVEDEDGDQE